MPLSEKQREENDHCIRSAKGKGNSFGTLGQQGVEDLLARILEVQMETLSVLEQMQREDRK